MGVETGSRGYQADGAQAGGTEAAFPGLYRMDASGLKRLGGHGLTGAFAPGFGSSWSMPRLVTLDDMRRESGGAATTGVAR